LFSPARGEKTKEKNFNTPSPLPSPAGWRGEKEDEKILTMPPHPDPLQLVERVDEEKRI